MLKKYFDEVKYEHIKKSDNLIYKAMEIATTLFEKDLDKGGMPYILHIIAVYTHVNTLNEKVVALLHDVIEDKEVTCQDLEEVGFPQNIIDDVFVLTRVKPIDYSDYINNIVANGSVVAMNVKLADLENNMDIARISNPTVEDYERIKRRYIPSHEKIMNRLKELAG